MHSLSLFNFFYSCMYLFSYVIHKISLGSCILNAPGSHFPPSAWMAIIWASLGGKKMASHFKEQKCAWVAFLLFGKLKERKRVGPLGKIKTNDCSCETESHSLSFPTVWPTISSRQALGRFPPVDKWLTLPFTSAQCVERWSLKLICRAGERCSSSQWRPLH